MRGLSTRERLLVALVGFVLVVFVLAFAVVSPMAERAATLADQQATYEDAISRAQDMYRAVPEIRSEVESMRTEVAKMMFPQENVKIGVVREIDDLASELGIQVMDLRPPGDPESVAGYLKYSTSFKVSSGFAKSVRLLYELERPSRRLWVEGVEMAAGRQGGGDLQISVHVAAYVRGNESEEDDVEA